MHKNIKNKNLSPKSMFRLSHTCHYRVQAHNSLIQKTSSQLSTGERKLILHLIQRISIRTKNLCFKFNCRDYARFLGIKPNVTNARYIKKELKRLADKSFWLRTNAANLGYPSRTLDTLIRWFSKVSYLHGIHGENTGTFIIQFDKRLKPFLLNLKSHFTDLDYSNVIEMNHTYSIRIYEILVSHYNQQGPVYVYENSISNLRFLLGIPSDKYKRFGDFNNRVIKPAINEINYKTNFNIKVTQLKDGHTTVGLRFLLSSKNKLEHEKRSYSYKHIGTTISFEKSVDSASFNTLKKFLSEYKHHKLVLDKTQYNYLTKAIINKILSN